MSARPLRCHVGACLCLLILVPVSVCLLEVSLLLNLALYAALIVQWHPLPSRDLKIAPAATTDHGPSRRSRTSSLRQGVGVFSLKDLEDSERTTLASVWAGFAETLLPHSDLDAAGVTLKQLGHLFLDKSPATLRRHLCGWSRLEGLAWLLRQCGLVRRKPEIRPALEARLRFTQLKPSAGIADSPASRPPRHVSSDAYGFVIPSSCNI